LRKLNSELTEKIKAEKGNSDNIQKLTDFQNAVYESLPKTDAEEKIM